MSCLRSSQSEASNAGEDVVGGFHPDKWLGICIVGREVEANGILQSARAAVAPATDLLFGELSEPTFHLIDPGRVGGREMQVESRVAD